MRKVKTSAATVKAAKTIKKTITEKQLEAAGFVRINIEDKLDPVKRYFWDLEIGHRGGVSFTSCTNMEAEASEKWEVEICLDSNQIGVVTNASELRHLLALHSAFERSMPWAA